MTSLHAPPPELDCGSQGAWATLLGPGVRPPSVAGVVSTLDGAPRSPAAGVRVGRLLKLAAAARQRRSASR